MAQEFSKTFYESGAWKKCRDSYIAYRRSVDGGMCEICHDVPGYIVHHKKALNPDNINDPDITMGADNLQFVCLNCHNDIHNAKKIPAEGMINYFFSPDGEPIATPPELSELF